MQTWHEPASIQSGLQSDKDIKGGADLSAKSKVQFDGYREEGLFFLGFLFYPQLRRDRHVPGSIRLPFLRLMEKFELFQSPILTVE